MTEDQLRSRIATVYQAAATAADGDHAGTFAAILGALGAASRHHPAPAKSLENVLGLVTRTLLQEIGQAPEYPALCCLMAAAPGDRVLALRLAVAMVGGLIGVGPDPAIEFRAVAQGMREHADSLSAEVPPQGEPS